MTARAGVTPELSRERFSPAGWLLVGALVYAPWCWGCTWPRGVEGMNFLLLAATLAGMAGLRCHLADKVPRVLLIAVGLLLFQGWIMTLNARSIVAEATGFLAPLDRVFPGLPGSFERDRSWETMARVTGLLGALWLAAKLGQSSRWRRRFLWSMNATAGSIVLLGCGQRWDTRPGYLLGKHPSPGFLFRHLSECHERG